MLHTEFGDLQLAIPRNRNGEFKQQTVVPYRRSNDTLEAFVIHMFQKGVTNAEIADLIERMYGHHYTPQTISNLTKVMSDEFLIAKKSVTISKRFTVQITWKMHRKRSKISLKSGKHSIPKSQNR